MVSIIREPSLLIFSSPSFDSFSVSSRKLAEIADKVVREMKDSSDPALYDAYGEEAAINNQLDDDEKLHCRFEFKFASLPLEEPQVTADEMFLDGKIRPFYYPFASTDEKVASPPHMERLPPSKVVTTGETRDASSPSCSEANQLEGLDDGSYCLWYPNWKTASPKSRESSTTVRSCRRWRLKELFYLMKGTKNGSHRDGAFLMFLASPEQYSRDKSSGEKKRQGGAKQRRSYLPYKHEILGLFTGAKGVTWKVKPF